MGRLFSVIKQHSCREDEIGSETGPFGSREGNCTIYEYTRFKCLLVVKTSDIGQRPMSFKVVYEKNTTECHF